MHCDTISIDSDILSASINLDNNWSEYQNFDYLAAELETHYQPQICDSVAFSKVLKRVNLGSNQGRIFQFPPRLWVCVPRQGRFIMSFVCFYSG